MGFYVEVQIDTYDAKMKKEDMIYINKLLAEIDSDKYTIRDKDKHIINEYDNFSGFADNCQLELDEHDNVTVVCDEYYGKFYGESMANILSKYITSGHIHFRFYGEDGSMWDYGIYPNNAYIYDLYTIPVPSGDVTDTDVYNDTINIIAELIEDIHTRSDDTNNVIINKLMPKILRVVLEKEDKKEVDGFTITRNINK